MTALPPVSGPGGTPERKDEGREEMQKSSDATKQVWKSAQPSVNTEQSKVIIGKHKFTNGFPEGTQKTDKKMVEANLKLQP